MKKPKKKKRYWVNVYLSEGKTKTGAPIVTCGYCRVKAGERTTKALANSAKAYGRLIKTISFTL